MGNIYKVSIACVFTAFGAHAWGACESGSAGDRIACLQMNFCPNPASTQERTACFQMITAALQDETANSALPPAEIASQPAEVSVPGAEIEAQIAYIMRFNFLAQCGEPSINCTAQRILRRKLLF